MEDKNTTLIQWLLEEDEPSLRYRITRELLEVEASTDEETRTRNAIQASAPVQAILQKMHPDGYWLQRNPRTNALVGDDVLYGSFASSHFCLAYLAELGVDRSHPQVEKAAERYLSLQTPDGDWLGHYSCLYGYNIRTFIRLGYREDARLQRSIDLMLETQRADGGYLCDMHEGKYKSRSVKSCVRGAVKCLMAFAELPEYWGHTRGKQLVEYFLNRGGIYRAKQPGVLVNKDMERFSFPITWRANLWEVLWALGKMGYGEDKRLQAAWSELERRSDSMGHYHLDWTPTECPWKVGERGQPNKWVTFYILLAEKYHAQ